MSGIDVRRSGQRFLTRAEGRTTRHSFSFGEHYDPGNVGFGFLLCQNDDLLAPGHGYPSHPHRDVEIVTWVVAGGLHHEDSLGHSGVVVPGQVQRTSAGSGIVHAEVADAADGPVRFVQVWLAPDEPGAAPSYELAEAGSGSGWLVLTSGLRRYAGETATSLGNASSAVLAARLAADGSVVLPDAGWLHLFVADGEAELEGAGTLRAGDAVRLTDNGGRRLTARDGAEVLLAEMHPRRAGASFSEGSGRRTRSRRDRP